MKACPLEFQHPSQAQQLNGLGPKLCDRLTEKLKAYCEENGLPMAEHPNNGLCCRISSHLMSSSKRELSQQATLWRRSTRVAASEETPKGKTLCASITIRTLCAATRLGYPGRECFPGPDESAADRRCAAAL